jgi:serine/threonine-protein kinase RsbT
MPCGIPSGSPETDRVVASSMAYRFAAKAGLGKRGCSEVAICVAELVSNVARHATGGELTMRIVTEPRRAVEIVVRDRGPGMADPELASRDGWSRGAFLGPDDPRREGLGAGLGSVRRLMNEMRIESVVGVGTTVTARKWL